jgi:hypothetical protein
LFEVPRYRRFESFLFRSKKLQRGITSFIAVDVDDLGDIVIQPVMKGLGVLGLEKAVRLVRFNEQIAKGVRECDEVALEQLVNVA